MKILKIFYDEKRGKNEESFVKWRVSYDICHICVISVDILREGQMF